MIGTVRQMFIRERQKTVDHQVGQAIRPKNQTESEVLCLPGHHLGLTSLVLSARSKAFPNKKWRRCDSSWRCNASGVPTHGDNYEHATGRI